MGLGVKDGQVHIKQRKTHTIAIEKNFSRNITTFIAILDIVIMLRIQIAQGILNVIPTVDKTEDEVEHFYDDVQQALDI